MDRWERVMSKYGLATVLALFLVWWLTSGVSGNLSTIKDMLHDHVSESGFYMRAMCVHAAHSEAERAECIPPTR